MRKILLLTILSVSLSSCLGGTQKTENYSSDTTLLDTTVVAQAETTATPQSYSQPQAAESSPTAPVIPKPPARDITTIRIQNSMVQTDKTISCYASIDESSKILTLEALRSSDLFKMSYEGGGVFTIYFYDGNSLEASKKIYRREDLETNNRDQIYTSRTGEIIITLSNN